jgi:hypothetical protein
MSSIREGRLRVKAGLSWYSSSEEKEVKETAIFSEHTNSSTAKLRYAARNAQSATASSASIPTVRIRDEKLTSDLPPSLIQLPSIRLIPPTRLPNRLISRRHQHNRKERHNQRAGARDAPPAENDAEIRRVPCEEHLLSQLARDGLRWVAKRCIRSCCIGACRGPCRACGPCGRGPCGSDPLCDLWCVCGC